jgi:DNA topoisomerase-1
MRYERVGDYNIGFTYMDIKKRVKVSDEETLHWIKTLKIPPAYTKVCIENNRNAKILAYGYDTKNRKQYIYNPKFVNKMSTKKYSKILELNDVFKRIADHIQKDILSKDQRTKEIAIILYLIIYCGFRIGNKSYEKANGSYGISTIKFKHMLFNKGILTFDFIGKKGVRNTGQCDNKHIYNYLRSKQKLLTNSDSVFENISSSDVNHFLKQFHNDITSKDLRTWNANTLFIKYATEAAASSVKDPIKKAIEQVSIQLHNTVAVCKKNYIDPKIIDSIDIKLKIDTI